MGWTIRRQPAARCPDSGQYILDVRHSPIIAQLLAANANVVTRSARCYSGRSRSSCHGPCPPACTVVAPFQHPSTSSKQFAQVEGLQRRRWEIVGEDFGKANGTAGEALNHPAVGHDADSVGGGRIPGEDAKTSACWRRNNAAIALTRS